MPLQRLRRADASKSPQQFLEGRPLFSMSAGVEATGISPIRKGIQGAQPKASDSRPQALRSLRRTLHPTTHDREVLLKRLQGGQPSSCYQLASSTHLSLQCIPQQVQVFFHDCDSATAWLDLTRQQVQQITERPALIHQHCKQV